MSIELFDGSVLRAFDGRWITYISWERGNWRLSRPQRVDLGSLHALVDKLVALSEILSHRTLP
jgi:hypothetical protein